MKKKILIFALIISGEAIFAQVSLYNGADPYRKLYQNGDLVKVSISELLTIEVKNDWSDTTDMKLKLVPDQKYFDFLQGAEQSRTSDKKQKIRNTIKEKFELNILARVQRLNNDLLSVSAQKDVTLDGRVSIIRITGITHPRFIKDSVVMSENIAQLAILITVRPPVIRSNTVTTLEAGETENEPPSLSKAQKDQILLNHIREILGALEQQN
ncbi:MAG: flagellar basal body L-ring protein FlgH [Leptospirales bacterium]